MPQSSALTYLEENHARFQNELIELLRIQSISHDPAPQSGYGQSRPLAGGQTPCDGCEPCGDHAHNRTFGCVWRMVEWRNSAPTVLIYGHYDVQSPEPLEDWKSQPFEPDIRNENLYARGSSDMKGQTLAAVNAVEAIIKTENLPINIKFLIEGEEEIRIKSI